MSNNICPSCFSRQYAGGKCGNCGFTAADYKPERTALPLGSLAGAYRIGVMKFNSRQSQVYTAVHDETSTPAIIEEFFPAQLAGRAPGTGEITLASKDPETVRRFQQACLLIEASSQKRPLKRTETFRANNTVYSVFEPVGTVSPAAQCEMMSDNPYYFRDQNGMPTMTINALPIPGMPAERAYEPNQYASNGPVTQAASAGDLYPDTAAQTEAGRKKKILLFGGIAAALAVCALALVFLLPHPPTDGGEGVETPIISDAGNIVTTEQISEQIQEPLTKPTPETTVETTPETTKKPKKKTEEPPEEPTPETTKKPKKNTEEPTEEPIPEPEEQKEFLSKEEFIGRLWVIPAGPKNYYKASMLKVEPSGISDNDVAKNGINVDENTQPILKFDKNLIKSYKDKVYVVIKCSDNRLYRVPLYLLQKNEKYKDQKDGALIAFTTWTELGDLPVGTPVCFPNVEMAGSDEKLNESIKEIHMNLSRWLNKKNICIGLESKGEHIWLTFTDEETGAISKIAICVPDSSKMTKLPSPPESETTETPTLPPPSESDTPETPALPTPSESETTETPALPTLPEDEEPSEEKSKTGPIMWGPGLTPQRETSEDDPEEETPPPEEKQPEEDVVSITGRDIKDPQWWYKTNTATISIQTNNNVSGIVIISAADENKKYPMKLYQHLGDGTLLWQIKDIGPGEYIIEYELADGDGEKTITEKYDLQQNN